MQRKPDVEGFVRRQEEKAVTNATPRPKVRREQRGNIEILTAESSTIRTVPDLLDACGIPRESLALHGDTEFVVSKSDARKYDSIFGMKDGDKKTPIVVPLWYVSATLLRRKAVAVKWEPVPPIVVALPNGGKIPPRQRTASTLRCALVLPDSQHGYYRNHATGALVPLHDRRACDIALQLAVALKPDRIVLLGDMLDLSDWSSKFVQGPEFAYMAKHAGIDLAWWIAQLRLASPGAVIDYIEGNHEHRMPKLMQANAAQACDLTPVDDAAGPPLMSVERWLGLKSLGVQYHGPYPHGRVWITDKLAAVHGEIARNRSGATVAAILPELRHSEIQGHIHRRESAAITTHPQRGQREYSSSSPGTLARIDGAVPAATARVNWQQGLAVATYEQDSGAFQLDTVAIHEGRAIYGGQVYVGADYAARMASELKRPEYVEFDGWKVAA